MALFQVTISGDAATMTKGAWTQTVGVIDLPKWLTFYRGLCVARPASSKFYAQPIEALEAACVAAGLPIPPAPETTPKGRR
jgi:hypothetical protein